jgi:hypothetical protein
MPHHTLTEPWWTPWPGIGPGRDVLGDVAGLMVLELGCGKGDNAAAFAYEGATVTGSTATGPRSTRPVAAGTSYRGCGSTTPTRPITSPLSRRLSTSCARSSAH